MDISVFDGGLCVFSLLSCWYKIQILVFCGIGCLLLDLVLGFGYFGFGDELCVFSLLRVWHVTQILVFCGIGWLLLGLILGVWIFRFWRWTLCL